MKSIRLSLIVYFLLLLAAALGTVFPLVYRFTSRSLEEKQSTHRQLLRTQYDERRRAELAKTDAELVDHARLLVNLAQSQFESNRQSLARFLPLGALSGALSPQAHLLLPLYAAEARSFRVVDVVSRRVAREIHLDEDLLHRGSEDRSSDFFQIHDQLGQVWRSKSLGDRVLPFDAAVFKRMTMLDWEFDTVDVGDAKVRRVHFKAPIVRFSFTPSSRRFFGRGDGGSRTGRSGGSGFPVAPAAQPENPPPPPDPITSEAPAFFIQCATDISERDRALAQMEVERDQELAAADTSAQRDLDQLKTRLLWIGLATFVAICVGSSLLIGYGLAPLRRLSEAVGKVSDKDFRLAFSGPAPPAELAPIVQGIRQTLDMLRDAFAREKQATADISHELRTPLAGLLTTLEVTLRKPRSTEEYREALEECRTISKQLGHLVQRLLTLSRLDSRTDVVRTEPVDVGVLADECAAVVRPLAKAQGLELHVTKEADHAVAADPDKLREVLANLLHNAIEYNRPNGSVHLNVRTTDTSLDVEVRDTGVGIAPEHRQRIFERFFRADESRHATGVHAGLGLSIVRGYVQLMGGEITVDSEVGSGTTFRVHIPTTPL